MSALSPVLIDDNVLPSLDEDQNVAADDEKKHPLRRSRPIDCAKVEDKNVLPLGRMRTRFAKGAYDEKKDDMLFNERMREYQKSLRVMRKEPSKAKTLVKEPSKRTEPSTPPPPLADNELSPLSPTLMKMMAEFMLEVPSPLATPSTAHVTPVAPTKHWAIERFSLD